MAKLLIIEDDQFMRSLYDNTFSLAGYEVVLAHDGKSGLNLAKVSHPSLILLDVMMPEISGLEVLTQLKADEATKHIPVAMLSNLGEDENKKQAFQQGAIAYIVKSEHEPSALVTLIKELLEKYQTAS